MYSAIRTRKVNVKAAEGLYTVEKSNNLTEGNKEKRRKIGDGLSIVDSFQTTSDSDPSLASSKSPWIFFVALEALMRSFSKAGC